MVPRMPDDEIREAASWLVNQVQVLAVNDPHTFRIIERAARRILLERHRQIIAERLDNYDARTLQDVDAFLDMIDRVVRRDDDDTSATS